MHHATSDMHEWKSQAVLSYLITTCPVCTSRQPVQAQCGCNVSVTVCSVAIVRCLPPANHQICNTK